jgi:phage terminase large subunit-like protein
VRLPAIAEEDELYRVETVFGRQCFGRKAGEALHPEREPPEMLAQLRRTLGEYNFAGQYQQAPSPQGGSMIKTAWFKSYAANERPEKFDRIVQSWDTANKASELSDFSVCTSWGIKGKDLYLLHVLRKRMEYPELKRAVREQCEAFAANVVLIEDKASGTQLIQELIERGLHAERAQASASKYRRNSSRNRPCTVAVSPFRIAARARVPRSLTKLAGSSVAAKLLGGTPNDAGQ